MFLGTELEGAGVKVLVKKLGNVRGIVEHSSEGIRVIIPAITKLSEFLADILSEPRHHQFSFLT